MRLVRDGGMDVSLDAMVRSVRPLRDKCGGMRGHWNGLRGVLSCHDTDIAS